MNSLSKATSNLCASTALLTSGLSSWRFTVLVSSGSKIYTPDCYFPHLVQAPKRTDLLHWFHKVRFSTPTNDWKYSSDILLWFYQSHVCNLGFPPFWRWYFGWSDGSDSKPPLSCFCNSILWLLDRRIWYHTRRATSIPSSEATDFIVVEGWSESSLIDMSIWLLPFIWTPLSLSWYIKGRFISPVGSKKTAEMTSRANFNFKNPSKLLFSTKIQIEMKSSENLKNHEFYSWVSDKSLDESFEISTHILQ